LSAILHIAQAQDGNGATGRKREQAARAMRDAFFEQESTDDNWNATKHNWLRIFDLLETKFGALGLRVVEFEKGKL
jgi:hypothetical protein